MNGRSKYYYKRDSKRTPLPLLSCEDSEKKIVYEPGSKASPDTESSGILILGFPGSRAVRNTILLIVSTQSMIFWTRQLLFPTLAYASYLEPLPHHPLCQSKFCILWKKDLPLHSFTLVLSISLSDPFE
jgi:hypothetical protein